MNYPKCLYQKNRIKLEDSQIKNNHYLFMRNKPGYGWKIEDNFPDFNTIKLDQSLNWCRFSIPSWVRFNEEKIYQKENAVIGIKCEVIRYSKKYDNSLENFLWTVIHSPLEINYSHSELLAKNQNYSKDIRRALRITLKNKCIIYLKPNDEFNLLIKLYHLIKMLLYKIL